MIWERAVVWTYTLGLVLITVYAVFQLHLLILYYRWRRGHPRRAPLDSNAPDLAVVTVQVPVYNERFVIERIVDAVAAFRWPADRLEIQIVDDSTDDTSALAAARAAYWRERGVQIHHVRRPARDGFKAGALAEATARARGEFLAIFDADFVPQPDFLLRTMAYFDAPDIGVVQARWGHLNRTRSLLTRLQAILLDGFYLIEQPGRAFGGFMLRFNGSAGVWRRTCLTDAGGWSADTLSEDLDLCYRAQLRGWTLRYAHEVVAPAELPLSLRDFKEQQYRWTRGKAQVIRKLGRAILRSSLTPMAKAHAFADLFNIFAYAAAFVCTVLSLPVAWVVYASGETLPPYLVDTSFALLPLVVWIFYVVVIVHHEYGGRFLRTAGSFAALFPPLLGVVIGITYYQTVALVRGLAGGPGVFFRTPKYGAGSSARPAAAAGSYATARLGWVHAAEVVLAAYFTIALWMDVRSGAVGFVPLHAAAGLGYVFVAVRSLTEARAA